MYPFSTSLKKLNKLEPQKNYAMNGNDKCLNLYKIIMFSFIYDFTCTIQQLNSNLKLSLQNN
jgi:hypothetical protein